jgi:hypothetical protein
MTAEAPAAAAEDARTALAAAWNSLQRVRHTVEDQHDVTKSALGVVYYAELDSAKARLSDRGSFYLEAAAEHMARLQSRCNIIRELTSDLTDHLGRPSRAIAATDALVEELDHDLQLAG